ncbi:NAD(P)/FAD-dependent oxidoreductase [Burkholderia sp. BE17]|uniref:NAD(P)/FAD-dependent oxidoreductase n=1 Tax=Burkholderia sp. BE17 TaxID=2656644 RepID=UPI0039EF4486
MAANVSPMFDSVADPSQMFIDGAARQRHAEVVGGAFDGGGIQVAGARGGCDEDQECGLLARIERIGIVAVRWVQGCLEGSRLIWGGKVSYSTLPPRNLGAAMRRDMLKTFPQLADVAIDYAWGGLVDITMNRAPHFGRVRPTIYFAQGFSGHGLNVTALAGKVIAEAINGQTSRFELFARIPHRDFPGGALLRMPALVLAMGWYRLRDVLGFR